MHPLRRFVFGTVLLAGAALGFGHGFASLARARRLHHEVVTRHIAQVCVDAARGHQGVDSDRP